MTAPRKARLVVCGAAGRMGRLIVNQLRDHAEAELAGAIEASGNEALGKDAGEVAGGGPLDVPVTDDLASTAERGTTVLDFTVAEAAMANARTVATTGASMVIGTSGLAPEQRTEVEELATTTPMILAANTSVGVNVLLRVVAEATRLLGSDFDPEIVELHHRMKVDAPSGTAVALARAVAQTLGRDPDETRVSGRDGHVGRRTDEEIGVMAVRGGDTAGEHTVYFLGQGERLELTHRTQGRECLARGAVRAGVWLSRQKAPGLYTMADVLGIG